MGRQGKIYTLFRINFMSPPISLFISLKGEQGSRGPPGFPGSQVNFG